MSYKRKDRDTQNLFEDLFPYGGKLDVNNRWMKISKLIPWEELENRYATYFANRGRPGTDARLAVGLFLLKHLSGKSDVEVVLELLENPYWQSFCGLEGFANAGMIEPSSLSRLRKRLGTRYVKELEAATYGVLIERKIIKAKGMLADGTVIPENIKFPTDVGLLNDVRVWLVNTIKRMGKAIGKRYRTYSRKGHRAYLNFAKAKRKTKKQLSKARKQMLQFVRRNVSQLKDAVDHSQRNGMRWLVLIGGKLKTAEEIFEQQFKMYKEKSNRIANRIVSFHRPWVRPMKRGKSGRDVEFGAKSSMSHVDGFLFLDEHEHDNYSEAGTGIVRKQLRNYEKRFGKKPPSFTGDNLYGSRGNRELLEEEQGIRTSFVRLGKKRKASAMLNQWFRRKQKERNRIEGHFGHAKEHYRLDRALYQGKDGSEIWARYGILAMNLKTALYRA